MLERPLLIYDGQCRFCRYCVNYARAATGTAVDYQPYQAVAQDFPALSEAACRQSIQLLEPGGGHYSGADAAFRVLARGSRGTFLSRCYSGVPLFGALSEWTYRLVANHRTGCYRTCRLLFGPAPQPSAVELSTRLFLQLLALVYLIAFISFALQAPGLVGDNGILPAERYFNTVGSGLGAEKYWLLPSLLWLDASTQALQLSGALGATLSLLLLFQLLPRLCLPCLYLLYLSLYYGGQNFMSYQWDVLLLECGFLAIFLPWSPRLFCWLYRWLLFRFMLQSGLVKLFSGDPSWRSFTALDYHFETQPLPTVLAWYADKLPALLLQGGVLLTFLVELVVPFLMLMPRRPRMVAAACTALFQLTIIATGSYNFFNLLTLGLCVLLLDDQFLSQLPWRLRPAGSPRTGTVGKPRLVAAVIAVVALLYLSQSAIILAVTALQQPPSAAARRLLTWTAPFHIANNYGVFAVMTTQRHEIIFEGSSDGRRWLPYELPYKPGALHRRPQFAAPHQPRLDWQLWFAALAPREQNPWLGGLVKGLLQGSPEVLALFADDPFAGQPPRYVRAMLYRYRFSSREQQRDSGAWWTREPRGEFWPVTGWQLVVEPVAAGNTPPAATPPLAGGGETRRQELEKSIRETLR